MEGLFQNVQIKEFFGKLRKSSKTSGTGIVGADVVEIIQKTLVLLLRMSFFTNHAL
jgi:hypothetical protein